MNHSLRSPRHRSAQWAAGAILLLCFGAACATPYSVVKSAEPNPFSGVRSFAVLPLEFVALQVDDMSEEAFLARKEDEREKWETIKDNIRASYDAGLKQKLQSAGIQVDANAAYTIRSFTSKIDTGYYRIPAWNAVSRPNIQIEIKDASGQVLDELFLDHGVAFDALIAPTVNVRLRRAAASSGAGAGAYLKKRVE